MLFAPLAGRNSFGRDRVSSPPSRSVVPSLPIFDSSSSFQLPRDSPSKAPGPFAAVSSHPSRLGKLPTSFVAQTINCLPSPCKLHCRTLRWGPSAAVHGNQTKCLITDENFGGPAHLKADKPPACLLVFHVDARSRSSVTLIRVHCCRDVDPPALTSYLRRLQPQPTAPQAPILPRKTVAFSLRTDSIRECKLPAGLLEQLPCTILSTLATAPAQTFALKLGADRSRLEPWGATFRNQSWFRTLLNPDRLPTNIVSHIDCLAEPQLIIISSETHTFAMAAVNMSLVARSEYAVHQLMKRQKNWAQREPGVIVVFVIVFLVAILVIAMFINKKVRSPSTPSPTTSNVLTPHIETSWPPRRCLRYPTERVESYRCVGERTGAAEVGALCDNKRERVYVNGKSKDLVYNVFEHFPQIVGYMVWVFCPLRLNAVVPNANDWVRCNNETVKYYLNEHSFVHICIVIVHSRRLLGKSLVAIVPNPRDLLNAPHQRLELVAHLEFLLICQ
jgi:hypothetical protein